MKKVKIELDATRNIFTYYIEVIIRFFAVPIDLFKIYFIKFRIKKTSRFYKIVNYPLANLMVKYLIIGFTIEYLFVIGLYIFEIDQRSIIISASLLALIVFTPTVLKISFIMFIMNVNLSFRILKSIFFTFKSLFTEHDYF